MIRRNIPLIDYSNYKIGGPAAYFIDVSSKEELIERLRQWNDLSKNFPQNKKRIFILGKGTNILISEKGFDGLVIHNSIGGIKKSGTNLTVGAGELFSGVLQFCIRNSLSGLEWAGGLPGTVGGAIRGNAGAFSGETKDKVWEVTSLDLKTLVTKKRNNTECFFTYRGSTFKNGDARGEIIISALLKLERGNKELIKNQIREKIDYRNEKHPMEYPNIGSTFKNIPFKNVPKNLQNELSEYIKNDPFPIIPVAKLLFLCKLKGKREGDAQISEKHPNFIVNLGNAKYQDVIKLISFSKKTVKKKFGINLEEEIMYL